MRSSLGLITGMLALSSVLHAQSAPVGKSACSVLSAAEVSSAIGKTVAVDPDQSGPDASDRENCVWALKNGPSVTLQIERQIVPANADLAFTRQATIAFGRFPMPGKPSPQPVAGLGTQSLYRDWDGSVQGGAVVVQAGAIHLEHERRREPPGTRRTGEGGWLTTIVAG